MGIAMALPNNFTKVLETHLELAAELLDHASMFRERIDDLEHQQEMVDFEHKMAKYAIRERYAKAMMYLYHSRKVSDYSNNTMYDVKGDAVRDIDSVRICHIPIDWEIIWQRVYGRVHSYLKNIRLQYHNGRNPSQITTSHQLKVVVNKD